MLYKEPKNKSGYAKIIEINPDSTFSTMKQLKYWEPEKNFQVQLNLKLNENGSTAYKSTPNTSKVRRKEKH